MISSVFYQTVLLMVLNLKFLKFLKLVSQLALISYLTEIEHLLQELHTVIFKVHLSTLAGKDSSEFSNFLIKTITAFEPFYTILHIPYLLQQAYL